MRLLVVRHFHGCRLAVFIAKLKLSSVPVMEVSMFEASTFASFSSVTGATAPAGNQSFNGDPHPTSSLYDYTFWEKTFFL